MCPFTSEMKYSGYLQPFVHFYNPASRTAVEVLGAHNRNLKRFSGPGSQEQKRLSTWNVPIIPLAKLLAPLH